MAERFDCTLTLKCISRAKENSGVLTEVTELNDSAEDVVSLQKALMELMGSRLEASHKKLLQG